MEPTDRTIREELHREVADLPIPADMWQRINQRLDTLPHVVTAPPPQRQHWLTKWRPALVVAAAGIFWLSVVPASRVADEHPTRPVVAVHRGAIDSDDGTGPNRTAPIPFVPHPQSVPTAATTPFGRGPMPLQ